MEGLIDKFASFCKTHNWKGLSLEMGRDNTPQFTLFATLASSKEEVATAFELSKDTTIYNEFCGFFKEKGFKITEVTNGTGDNAKCCLGIFTVATTDLDGLLAVVGRFCTRVNDTIDRAGGVTDVVVPGDGSKQRKKRAQSPQPERSAGTRPVNDALTNDGRVTGGGKQQKQRAQSPQPKRSAGTRPSQDRSGMAISTVKSQHKRSASVPSGNIDKEQIKSVGEVIANEYFKFGGLNVPELVADTRAVYGAKEYLSVDFMIKNYRFGKKNQLLHMLAGIEAKTGGDGRDLRRCFIPVLARKAGLNPRMQLGAFYSFYCRTDATAILDLIVRDFNKAFKAKLAELRGGAQGAPGGGNDQVPTINQDKLKSAVESLAVKYSQLPNVRRDARLVLSDVVRYKENGCGEVCLQLLDSVDNVTKFSRSVAGPLDDKVLALRACFEAVEPENWVRSDGTGSCILFGIGWRDECLAQLQSAQKLVSATFADTLKKQQVARDEGTPKLRRVKPKIPMGPRMQDAVTYFKNTLARKIKVCYDLFSNVRGGGTEVALMDSERMDTSMGEIDTDARGCPHWTERHDKFEWMIENCASPKLELKKTGEDLGGVRGNLARKGAICHCVIDSNDAAKVTKFFETKLGIKKYVEPSNQDSKK